MLCLTVLEARWQTEKRSLRSLSYRNGTSAISCEILSSVTQGKQHNAIFVTQNIPLAMIVLSIGEAYSWNKLISHSISRICQYRHLVYGKAKGRGR